MSTLKNNKSTSFNDNKASSNSIFFGLVINYFKPSTFVGDILDIDVLTLKENGVKLILCDLDNTLVPHFTKFPTKKVIDFVSKIEESGINFFIVSNNSKKRVDFFSSKLNLDDYIANAKKPFVKKIKKIIKENNLKKDEVIFVGDMLITDILAANILNIDSILVSPLISNDKSTNWLINFLEKKIFKKLSRENIITTKNQNIREKYIDGYEIL